MNVLFYTAVKDEAGECLQREIEAVVPKDKKEIHRTIESLSRRLYRHTSELTIAVLFTASVLDILDILAISDLLSDVRIILILPDREEATIAMGHALHPRFICYADSNFKDVAAVLKKMIKLTDSDNN